MINELSKQQRRVLLLLLMAILLGSGSLLYRSFQRGPLEVYLVSPVTAAWPGEEAKPGEESKMSLSINHLQAAKTEATENKPVVKAKVANPSQGGLIDPNLATSEELQTIPGIGPVLAERIIEYRTKVKKFERVEDLLAIKGIGEKTLEKIREYIVINP